MESNHQYKEMLTQAVKRLQDRDPQDLAQKGNLIYDEAEHCFLVRSLGRTLRINGSDFQAEPQPEMWEHLTILQYMSEADGTPLTGSYMALNEFKEGGLIRGSSFSRENDSVIQRVIGKADLSRVKEAVEQAGGTIISGKGDIAAEFSFLPNYPIRINIWLEDDEFPAACNILFDKSAEHYLKVEAAGTAAGILLQRIESILKKEL